jgi:hypothetical protein
MLKILKLIGLALVYLVGSIVSVLALIFALLDDLFFLLNSKVWKLRGVFK